MMWCYAYCVFSVIGQTQDEIVFATLLLRIFYKVFIMTGRPTGTQVTSRFLFPPGCHLAECQSHDKASVMVLMQILNDDFQWAFSPEGRRQFDRAVRLRSFASIMSHTCYREPIL